MPEVPIPSLVDFAASWVSSEQALPNWALAPNPLPLQDPSLRQHLEDVLDTVVALQRADWLESGVYVGPVALPEVYRSLVGCARVLGVAVPPAIIAGCAMSAQGSYGTDARAFLYLSSFFFQGSAGEVERRFLLGQLLGHLAARQVTANTLYALLVDHGGLRAVARRSLGPALEVVLAPLSIGVRLGLSRWHRAAVITADRAGLICAGDVGESCRCLLRLSLGVRPDLDAEAYLDQLRSVRTTGSPGRWAELLADAPWMHKRMRALELFASSECYARVSGVSADGPLDELLDDATLARRTDALLGQR